MRWGLIGAGAIAQQFAKNCKLLPYVKIDSVFTRDLQKARTFADEFAIPSAYCDFSDFIQNGNFDNVYVCVPHVLHKQFVMDCLRSGKNVLCEKPMGVNLRETEEMIQFAGANNVLLMEGMWTRFFPAMHKLREWRKAGVLGAIQNVSIDMSYDSIQLGEHLTWRFENKFAGGALLDLGVYAIFFALDLFDEVPGNFSGCAHLEGGIDRSNSFVLDFNGRFASITTSVVHESSNCVTITCENGRVEIPDPWWHADALRLILPDGTSQHKFPYECDGMQYEIEAFESAVHDKLTQCPLVPHCDSLAAVKIMDGLRKSWGLVFPADLQE